MVMNLERNAMDPIRCCAMLALDVQNAMISVNWSRINSPLAGTGGFDRELPFGEGPRVYIVTAGNL